MISLRNIYPRLAAVMIVIAFCLLGYLALSPGDLMADQPASASQLGQTARQFYDAGQYLQAAQTYQQLVDQGYSDPALYFNLGNAYFKADDLGRAILNYRRAQHLAPRDADIAANLAIARSQTTDQIDPAPAGNLFDQLRQTLPDPFTLDELARLTLGLWLLFSLLLLLASQFRGAGRGRSALRYALNVVTVALIVSGLALAGRIWLDQGQASGIIIAREVPITGGPGSQYVTEFVLHRGTEVEVIEMRGSWVRLALPGGQLEGWAPAEVVERVGL